LIMTRASKSQETYKKAIIRNLEDSGYGKTASEIAQDLDISRPTAIKYLKWLEREDKVKRHVMGRYNVFLVEPKQDQDLFQHLYLLLMAGFNDLQILDEKLLGILVTKFKHYSRSIIKKINLSFEGHIPDLSKEEQSYENLEQLVEIVRQFLRQLVIYGKNPSIEIIPPLGKLRPMSLLLKLEDPGFAEQNAILHYYFVARVIEEKISRLTHADLYFNVVEPIMKDGKNIYYELGYIENYYLELSIEENASAPFSKKDLLDQIKAFYASAIKSQTEERMAPDGPHYIFRSLSNRDLEEFFETIIRDNIENVAIASELIQDPKVRIIRKWVPIEDWIEPPYAVVNCVANFGYLVDEYIRTANQAYKFSGTCVHFEKIDGGWRLNLKERLDFDMLFTPLNEVQKYKEIYAQITTDPEEFLRRRYEALARLRKELTIKRVENMNEG